MNRPTLLYGVPTGGHPLPAFCASLRAIELTQTRFGGISAGKRHAHRGVEDLVFTTGPVQMARTAIARRMLDAGYDYLVMHDDDTEIMVNGQAGNVLDRFLETMEAYPDVGMIGVTYLRENPQVPTLMIEQPGAGADWEGRMVIGGFPFAPFEVWGIGTGFVMIRREALEDVADLNDGNDGEIFRFAPAQTPWGLQKVVGEDYDFCLRLHQCGWRVATDPRIATVHHKRSGRLEYEWGAWHDMCAAPEGGITLHLPENMRDAKLVEVPRTTLDGRAFNIVALDVYDVRKREYEDWAAGKEARAKARAARRAATPAVTPKETNGNGNPDLPRTDPVAAGPRRGDGGRGLPAGQQLGSGVADVHGAGGDGDADRREAAG